MPSIVNLSRAIIIGLLFEWLLFESGYCFIELSNLIGYYSSTATIQKRRLIEQIRYIILLHILENLVTTTSEILGRTLSSYVS